MEEWKIINNSDGKYEISNFGRCRNVKKGTILKENKSFKYGRYNICGKLEYTARLVAEHFLENPLHFNIVIHINEDNYDSVVSNLRWSKSVYSDKIIGMYNENDKLLRKFDSLSQAGRFFNTNHTLISLCINGKRNSAHGYYWKYI